MIIIAGSCSVESLNESLRQAELLSELGLKYLRFMIWKPRTNPSSFQGIGLEEGFKIMYEIHKRFPDIVFVTEIMDLLENMKLELWLKSEDISIITQIGTRNAQNYSLLKHFGSSKNQVILYKRGMSMTIDEFISGSEYLNPSQNNIWLCLRGIRTFETSTRNTPDLGSILTLKDRFEFLPDKYKIIFDPSHASGNRHYIERLCLMAQTGGADGLEIEMHSKPDDAISDSAQTIDFNKFKEIIKKLNNG